MFDSASSISVTICRKNKVQFLNKVDSETEEIKEPEIVKEVVLDKEERPKRALKSSLKSKSVSQLVPFYTQFMESQGFEFAKNSGMLTSLGEKRHGKSVSKYDSMVLQKHWNRENQVTP